MSAPPPIVRSPDDPSGAAARGASTAGLFVLDEADTLAAAEL